MSRRRLFMSRFPLMVTFERCFNPIRTRINPGAPPVQRCGASGFIPTMPARPEDLDLLPLTVATARKVQRDRIQFAVSTSTMGSSAGPSHRNWRQKSSPSSNLREARADRRRELEQLLRDRRSLADSFPSDTRYPPIKQEEPVVPSASATLPSGPHRTVDHRRG